MSKPESREGTESTNPLEEEGMTHAQSTEKPTDQPKQEHTKEPMIVSITDVELDQMKQEAAEYKDKYMRLLAESENTRKRMQKERQESIQYALQNTIVDFLIPIDHMENALKHAKEMSDDVKHWAIGFEMILNQFKDVLANNGIYPFESIGHAFDPHRHEAIEMVETEEYKPGTVVSENVRGYKMGDKKIIRPARVQVAKAPAKPVEEDILPTESAEE